MPTEAQKARYLQYKATKTPSRLLPRRKP